LSPGAQLHSTKTIFSTGASPVLLAKSAGRNGRLSFGIPSSQG